MSFRDRKYPICNCGKAMISTFAFSGKEYWCWNCGYTDTFFVSVERAEISFDDTKQLLRKERQAQEFLSARGCKHGGGMRKIGGKLTDYNDLPEEMKKEIDNLTDSWNYSKLGY